MTTITLRAQGAAPAELAWERYAQPSLWPTWSPPIRSVELAGVGSPADQSAPGGSAADHIAPGLRGVVHGPPGVQVHFVVTKVDEDARTWSWRARCGPVALTLDHGVRAEPGGSSTTLRITGSAPVVVSYAPLARLSLVRLVRA